MNDFSHETSQENEESADPRKQVRSDPIRLNLKTDQMKKDAPAQVKIRVRPHETVLETLDYLKERARVEAQAIRGEDARARADAIKQRLGIKAK